MDSAIEDLARSRDYCCLAPDEYAAYFHHLNRVFAFLRTWYRKLVEDGNKEAEIVEGFLGRLLQTVCLLRLKHLYNPAIQLTLDLNHSGFPHSVGVAELEADLTLKDERLRHLPNRRVLQELMLESMLSRQIDPTELLPQMAERQLAEMIDREKIVRPFTPGDVVIVNDNGKVKNCLFSWFCYDRMENIPYVYIMAFDYHGSTEKLREELAGGEFVEVIRKNGDRGTVPLIVTATSIDEELPTVFPKILKRVKVGPLVCPLYTAEDSSDPFVKWLRQYGEPADFVLFLEAEVLYSKGQEPQEERGWFSFAERKKARQIFALPAMDSVSGDRHVSQVQLVMMLPHHVLQQIASDPDFAEVSRGQQKVAYDLEGGIYVV